MNTADQHQHRPTKLWTVGNQQPYLRYSTCVTCGVKLGMVRTGSSMTWVTR